MNNFWKLSSRTTEHPQKPGLPVAADFELTQHASERLRERSISVDGVVAALDYGRVVYESGVMIYALGRREVEKCRKANVDIQRWTGLQVVCSYHRAVLTAYKKEDYHGIGARR